jgi:pSer/pThr/pTyr-binding forkhead associated (FHA) protein
VLQLKILNGQKAGAEWTARRFPVRIGRAPEAHLRLEEPGVWDTHAQIDLKPAEGFLLSVASGALASVNGAPVERAALRSGDVIELGALKLQFGLSPTRHRDLRLREALTWLALALLCLGQVALIYWLPN